MRNSADLISPCTQNHRIALIGKIFKTIKSNLNLILALNSLQAGSDQYCSTVKQLNEKRCPFQCVRNLERAINTAVPKASLSNTLLFPGLISPNLLCSGNM